MAADASQQPFGYHNYVRNIAIVGAGGRAGTYIVEALQSNSRSAHQTITALTRHGSTTNLPNGVKPAYIDYADVSSIVTVLRGQDVLIITMSVLAAPDSSRKLIQAAAEAGVKWVLPNEWGGDNSNSAASEDVMIYAAKRADRSLVEELGVSSWIGIACGFWYEFSLGGGAIRYGFDFNTRSVIFFDDGTTKINTSTWKTCGAAVGKLLALPILPQDESDKNPTVSKWKNAFVRVSSFQISQKDMFASALRVTGTQESDWAISYQPAKQRFEEGRAMMQKGNMAGFGQLLYARAFYADGAGNFSKHSKLDNDVLGVEKEELDVATSFGIGLHESGYFEEERKMYEKAGGGGGEGK